MHHPQWRAKPYNVRETARLSVEAGVSPLLAQLLLNRGIVNRDDARRFLFPTFADTHDPERLPGIAAAVARLRRALDSAERIVVYGDYDVDGTTSIALLMGVFRQLGGNMAYYIPDRKSEGYGLHVNAIQSIKDELGADLLITVDCGVTAHDAIAEAYRLGVDVIVTDHHHVDKQRLPRAENVIALIDPKLEGHDYPFDELAGVGLAFKLAQAVVGCSLDNAKPVLLAQLDLVALGTIADVAPLRDENRALAKLGMDSLNRRDRVGVRALCEVAGIASTSRITARDVSFKLAPRINAAGRLETAHKVVTLLTTESHDEAARIAAILNEENVARQAIQRRITAEAESIVEAKVNLAEDRAIVLASDDWHAGVIGLVAGRLAERFHRPTIVIALDGETGKGSGRSIPGFHLADALEASREHMVTFGGHAAAAGMTARRSAVKRLRESFVRTANERLTADDMMPRLDLDAILTLDRITLESVAELDRLDPVGDANPPPMFGVRGLSLVGEPRLVGAERRHVKVMLTDRVDRLDAIRWDGFNEIAPLKTAGAEIDVAGAIAVNEYQGTQTTQMTINSWRIHTQSPAIEKGVFPRREHPSRVRIVDNRTRREKTPYLLRVLERREPAIVYVRDRVAASEMRGFLLERNLMFVEASPDEEPESVRSAVQRFLAGDAHILLAAASVASFADRDEWNPLRHILLCHPPSDIETFVELASPVTMGAREPQSGDDTVYLHALFNEGDLEDETNRVNAERPDAETLREAARALRTKTCEDGMTFDQWAVSVPAIPAASLREAETILAELGFVRKSESEDAARLHWVDAPRRELDESARYRENLVARRSWELMAARWRRAHVRDLWEDVRRAAAQPTLTDA